MAEPKPDNHYVDNVKFYDALVDYNKKLTAARDANKPLPQIPEYIGECLMQISNRVAMMHNFRNYSFVNEMKSDALENCILYLESFKPDKTNNPFAYFTQCITFAFIRRIEKEHKQLYVKLKSLVRNATNESLLAAYQDPSEAVDIGFNPNDEFVTTFIRNYEEKQLKKKEKMRDNQRRKKQEAEFDGYDEETDPE